MDLKQPEGVEIMHRLVKTADVFVQNYRPGAARRLGVDYETLRRAQSAAHLLLDLRLRLAPAPTRAAAATT